MLSPNILQIQPLFAALAESSVEKSVDLRQPNFPVFDWIVIVVYALSMLAIGWYFSRRTDTTEEFLLGSRKMKPWAVGLSYFAALTSTVSYLMYPGEMIKHGPMIMGFLLAYPLAYLIVGWFLIPFIMNLKVTSAYEILESRFGLSVRMLGSTFFLVLRLLWMAVIVYATTDSVLVPLLRLDQSTAPWLCVVLGAITVIYTSMGGLQAVIWTDVAQTLIMMGGALLSIAVISVDLGGIAPWWPDHWIAGWDDFRLGHVSGARISILSAVMTSLTLQVCTAASDQIAVQRYLATQDVRAARRMFGIALLADTFVMLLLGALGLALLAFFQAHPELLPNNETVTSGADHLLPHFISSVLPAGLSGLVVAALLSAAMSSLSSGLNSCCSVLTVDWIDRFRRSSRSDQEEMRLVKIVSWIVGVIVVGVSVCCTNLISGNLLELAYKLVNLLVAPLAVLFFMAMFVPWATTFGTWAAAFASLIVAIGVGYFSLFGLNFMWLMPASLLAGFVTGSIVSLIRFKKDRTMTTVKGVA